MLPLAGQVQRASDTAKAAIKNLTAPTKRGSLPYWGAGRFDVAGMNRMLAAQKAVGALQGNVDWTKIIDAILGTTLFSTDNLALTLHHAPFAVDQFQFGQAQKKADMIEAFGSALPSELVVLAQERRQLERLQVMSEQKLGRIGHDAAPVSRPRYVLADVIATRTCGRYG